MEDELQALAAFVALSKLVEVGGLLGLLFVASDCVLHRALLSNVLFKPRPDSLNKVKATSVLPGISILSKCTCNKVYLSH